MNEKWEMIKNDFFPDLPLLSIPFIGWLRDGSDHVFEEFLHRILVEILDVAGGVGRVRSDRVRCQICTAYLLVL